MHDRVIPTMPFLRPWQCPLRPSWKRMTDANDSSSPTPANQEVASEELETPAKVDDSEVATDLSKKSSVTVKGKSYE